MPSLSPCTSRIPSVRAASEARRSAAAATAPARLAAACRPARKNPDRDRALGPLDPEPDDAVRAVDQREPVAVAEHARGRAQLIAKDPRVTARDDRDRPLVELVAARRYRPRSSP